MSASFADSNVLLYLPDRRPEVAAKAEAVLSLQPIISVQVLNEMARVMVGKWRLAWDDVEAQLALVRAATTLVPIAEDTHVTGIGIARRYRLAIYDSMIVAAALLAGCDTLYSEDMQHGLVVEGRLRIVNPFSPGAAP